MRLSEFDYELPKGLIAQYPSKVRGDERLLVIDRDRNAFEERHFADIVDYFKQGDVLVLNDTKVIPARLYGRRKQGGRVEIFVLNSHSLGSRVGTDDKRHVEALVRPSARIRNGESITLESGNKVKIFGKGEVGRYIEFDQPFDEVLERCGHIPLPPYISRADELIDKERYQTIYASSKGATASPTAGLHFTKEKIEELEKKGVAITYITLHVSFGTFAPIKEDIVERHKMHSEFYRISRSSIDIIQKRRAHKAKIFACGTTSLRVLETCANMIKSTGRDDSIAYEGFTDLFIYPGYRFNVADALITNFHLPRSTLLLLVCAFAGKELIFKAYRYAIEHKFRFFSYGDAMLII